MYKLAVGLSTLLSLSSVACGDGDTVFFPEEVGTAVFSLQGGERFSVAAEIDIAPVGAPDAVTQLTSTQGDATLQVLLAPGDYAAELTEFTLFDEGQPVPTADVTFTGFDPSPIRITSRSVTQVRLGFELGGEQALELDSAEGPPPELTVSVVSPCSPACGEGQRCANVGDSGPSCYDTCDDGTPCSGEASCFIPPGSDAGLCL